MSGKLPNFLVVGSAKCGTTSLWKRLTDHPDVFRSPTKEIHFFDEDANWTRGEAWYRSFFQDWQGEAAVGEATPTYLFSPNAAKRMATMLPNARLVAILRDPVKRAYSQYLHMRYYGWEPRSFDAAVKEELATPNWDVFPHYLAMGRYARQLERLLDHYEQDQMHVVLLDDMRKTPVPIVASVFEHIGVTPMVSSTMDVAENPFREVRFEPIARRLRASRFARRASPRMWRLMVRVFTREGGPPPPMGAGTRKKLYDVFVGENERLASWLGTDLSRWADPEDTQDIAATGSTETARGT